MVEVLGILGLLLLGLSLVLAIVEVVFILYSGNAIIFRIGPLVGKSVFELEESQLNKIGAAWQVLGESDNIRCGRVISQMLLVRFFAYKKSAEDRLWTVECRGPMFFWLIYPTLSLFALVVFLSTTSDKESGYALLGCIAFIAVYQVQVKLQVVQKLKKLTAKS
jgi:hypothetical protein